jgi:hypothetical protein
MPLAQAGQKSFTKWLAGKRFSRFAFDNRSRRRFPLSGTRPGVPAAYREFLDGENAALEFRTSEPRQCDGRVDRAATESVMRSRVTGMAT